MKVRKSQKPQLPSKKVASDSSSMAADKAEVEALRQKITETILNSSSRSPKKAAQIIEAWLSKDHAKRKKIA